MSIRTISFPDSSDWRSKVIFPCNIRKLLLYGCVINSGVLRTLCALHKLEVLTISFCEFKSKETCDEECGDESEREEETCDEESEEADGDESESEEETREEEWELADEDECESEGEICDEESEAADGDESQSKEERCEEEWEVADGDEFCSLQFLYLENLRLVRWIADETNFPRLRHLCLTVCFYLEEIPICIGEIPTLQLIQLDCCSKSAVASAKRIEEEQSENGNYDLKLRIIRD